MADVIGSIPQAILIYNLAIIYSVLRSGTTVLFFALIYFLLGHFFLKYQLLYAMESPAHSTGKAWPMIASRVTFSIVVFQIAMAGVLATKRAINRAVLIVPLIAFTIFFMFWFRRSYSPLMRYIALRAIERDENGEIRADGAGRGASALRDHHQDDETLAEHSDHGLAYANPSLVAPLPRLWISGRGDDLSSAAADDADSASRSSASGSENVWARSG